MVLTKGHCHNADERLLQNELFKDALWEIIVTTEDDMRLIWDRVALK